MATLGRALATLRITGDDLVPAEVAAALGCEPTRSFARGDTLTSFRTPRTAGFGMWSLEADESVTADVDAQVSAILERLTTDEGVCVDGTRKLVGFGV